MRARGGSAKQEGVLETIAACLGRSKPVRIELPGGGRLHIDRKLPFLFVHVFDTQASELLAQDVVSSNAAYALVSADPADAPFHRELIDVVHASMLEEFGSFLLVEVAEAERALVGLKDAPILPDYDLALAQGTGRALASTTERIKEAIEAAEIYYRRPRVRIMPPAGEAPPTLRGARLNLLEPHDWLGVVLPPVYFQPESEEIYPELFEALVTTVLDALLQGLADYCRAMTPLKPAHHRALGRRAFIKAIATVDRKLDAIARSFDFLLAVTPINSRTAWEEFREHGFRREPHFQYRPLPLSTDMAKRRLYALPLDHLEDPVLTKLFREKQHETDHQLSMLQCRNTPKFKDAGRLLYGNVDPRLQEVARGFLAATAEFHCSLSTGESVGCVELKALAETVLAGYRSRHRGFDAKVEIRDDIPAGLMVSGPCLLISSQTAMAKARVDALFQHEIGIHLVTYFAGKAQALSLFRSGLAGYEGIQEGLGVFAEYAVGGLSLGRLRLISARVVACAAMLDGATFLETFRLLTREFGFGNPTAFTMALRVHRSGGLAKDAIYLRGLLELLALLKEGGALDPFWFGKVAKSHLPVLAELEARGMLRPSPVRPAFLEREDAMRRIERARAGLALADLIAA